MARTPPRGNGANAALVAALLLAMPVAPLTGPRAGLLSAPKDDPTLLVSASGATAVGFPAPGVSVAREADWRRSIQAPFALQRLLDDMWRGSPTFRRQCARLSEELAVVRLHFSSPPWLSDRRATSQIVSPRPVEADVFLRPLDADMAETLAHEIEHVVEQMDRVDLRGAAARRIRGVTRHEDRYDTVRAVRVARQVSQELRERRR